MPEEVKLPQPSLKKIQDEYDKQRESIAKCDTLVKSMLILAKYIQESEHFCPDFGLSILLYRMMDKAMYGVDFMSLVTISSNRSCKSDCGSR
jgi:hypothetical protein